MSGRTSLTPYAASMREPDPDGARRAAHQAWHNHGIAVIMPGDCIGLDREFIQAVAVRLYGQRR